MLEINAKYTIIPIISIITVTIGDDMADGSDSIFSNIIGIRVPKVAPNTIFINVANETTKAIFLFATNKDITIATITETTIPFIILLITSFKIVANLHLYFY